MNPIRKLRYQTYVGITIVFTVIAAWIGYTNSIQPLLTTFAGFIVTCVACAIHEVIFNPLGEDK